MQNYVIGCGSTCDLSIEHIKSRNIEYIPFHYMMNDKTYDDDLWQSMESKEFYNAMVEGVETKTAQINVDEILNELRPFLKEGKDVIFVSLSSGISGSYNSSRVAGEILEEEFPERKIYMIDSLAASSGYGLLIDMMADLRDEGMNIEDLAKWTEENKLNIQHWFFSTDLTFYIKGGRVSKTSGFIGSMLNICPLLTVSSEGKLTTFSKIRGKKKVFNEIVSKMEEFALNGNDYDGKCYISNSNCIEDANAVATLIENKFPNIKGKIKINPIGPTIGCHTGPGTVALFFVGSKRNK